MTVDLESKQRLRDQIIKLFCDGNDMDVALGAEVLVNVIREIALGVGRTQGEVEAAAFAKVIQAILADCLEETLDNDDDDEGAVLLPRH
jgi:hypothetical protein